VVHKSLLVDGSDCRQQLRGTNPYVVLRQPTAVATLQKLRQMQLVVLAYHAQARCPASHHVDVLGQVRVGDVLAARPAARGCETTVLQAAQWRYDWDSAHSS
jgi:hypothetical protein